MTTTKTLLTVLYIWAALPVFYNLGSKYIGCPIYEIRTGQVCYDVLEGI
jgi:hypothetical protein